MRWRGERQSSNIEDRRGMSRGGIAVGGGLGGIVLIALALLFGADPRQILEQVPNSGQVPGQQSSRPINPEEEELKQFVATVLASTEDVWHEQFRLLGRQYREPKLQLFSDRAESACGVAGASVGPLSPANSVHDARLRGRLRRPGRNRRALETAYLVP